MIRWMAAATLLMATNVRAAPKEESVRLDPRADAQLRKMSDYLSAQKSFRVHTASSEDLVSTEGQKIQFLTEQELTLKRPNHLRIERRDPKVDTTVRYDGKQLSIFGKRTGYYATAPLPPKLSDAVDVLRERYGVDAPAADLIVEDPYDILMEDVTTGRYIGLETIEGVPVHHLAFTGKDVDWQIWIQEGSEPVPRRYSITSKHEKSKPEFTINLTNWRTNAPVDDSDFAFTPPPNSSRIPFRSITARDRSVQ